MQSGLQSEGANVSMSLNGMNLMNSCSCGAFTYVDAWRADGLSCFLKSSAEEESEFVGAISGTLEPCSSR